MPTRPFLIEESNKKMQSRRLKWGAAAPALRSSFLIAWWCCSISCCLCSSFSRVSHFGRVTAFFCLSSVIVASFGWAAAAAAKCSAGFTYTAAAASPDSPAASCAAAAVGCTAAPTRAAGAAASISAAAPRCAATAAAAASPGRLPATCLGAAAVAAATGRHAVAAGPAVASVVAQLSAACRSSCCPKLRLLAQQPERRLSGCGVLVCQSSPHTQQRFCTRFAAAAASEGAAAHFTQKAAAAWRKRMQQQVLPPLRPRARPTGGAAAAASVVNANMPSRDHPIGPLHAQQQHHSSGAAAVCEAGDAGETAAGGRGPAPSREGEEEAEETTVTVGSRAATAAAAAAAEAAAVAAEGVILLLREATSHVADAAEAAVVIKGAAASLLPCNCKRSAVGAAAALSPAAASLAPVEGLPAAAAAGLRAALLPPAASAAAGIAAAHAAAVRRHFPSSAAVGGISVSSAVAVASTPAAAAAGNGAPPRVTAAADFAAAGGASGLVAAATAAQLEKNLLLLERQQHRMQRRCFSSRRGRVSCKQQQHQQLRQQPGPLDPTDGMHQRQRQLQQQHGFSLFLHADVLLALRLLHQSRSTTATTGRQHQVPQQQQLQQQRQLQLQQQQQVQLQQQQQQSQVSGGGGDAARGCWTVGATRRSGHHSSSGKSRGSRYNHTRSHGSSCSSSKSCRRARGRRGWGVGSLEMNSAPPGSAFEEKMFFCRDNPIEAMPWETYIPFYKFYSKEDNIWLQLMQGNWTYADGRKMFDKPAGVVDGGAAVYEGGGTTLPLHPGACDRPRAQQPRLPRDRLARGTDFRETLDRPHRVRFDRLPCGNQDVYFGESDADLEDRLWGAFHHPHALEEYYLESGWRDLLPEFDMNEFPMPWTHTRTDLTELPLHGRDPSPGPPVAPLEFDLAAGGRFDGYVLDPGWTRQFDYVEQQQEMQRWQKEDAAAAEEVEEEEEAEQEQQGQEEVGSPQKKKKKKKKELSDPALREAYERGKLIIQTRYADIRQHPVYKKAIFEEATHASAKAAAERATPETILQMWRGEDIASDLPKVSSGCYDFEGGGSWAVPEGEGRTLAVNLVMEDIVPHANCYMSPKMTKEEMAEMWHYWMTEAHREGRYTDFPSEIGDYVDIEYETRANRRKFPRLMALYKPLWSHRKFGDEYGDALRPEETPPDSAFSTFGAPLEPAFPAGNIKRRHKHRQHGAEISPVSLLGGSEEERYYRKADEKQLLLRRPLLQTRSSERGHLRALARSADERSLHRLEVRSDTRSQAGAGGAVQRETPSKDREIAEEEDEKSVDGGNDEGERRVEEDSDNEEEVQVGSEEDLNFLDDYDEFWM